MSQSFDNRQAKTFGQARTDERMSLFICVLQVSVGDVRQNEQAAIEFRMRVEARDELAGVPPVAPDEAKLELVPLAPEALEGTQDEFMVLAWLNSADHEEYRAPIA